MDEWLSRLIWLQSLGMMQPLLEGMRPAKILHLTQEARSLYPSDLLDFTAPKRFTLLACLIFQAVVSTHDEIIQMFLKRMSKLTKKAKQELERLRKEERAITEHLVEVLADVVQASVDAKHALGCVNRTVFLLSLISDVKLREVIRRATNKVEQYNALEDWVRFAGGGTMYARAFEEQEKLVKYTGLLTNCIILDNTLEMSAALNTLAREGYVLTIDELAALSPYQTRHIKRFGNYEIDFSTIPALIADDLAFPVEPQEESAPCEAVQER